MRRNERAICLGHSGHFVVEAGTLGYAMVIGNAGIVVLDGSREQAR